MGRWAMRAGEQSSKMLKDRWLSGWRLPSTRVLGPISSATQTERHEQRPRTHGDQQSGGSREPAPGLSGEPRPSVRGLRQREAHSVPAHACASHPACLDPSQDLAWPWLLPSKALAVPLTQAAVCRSPPRVAGVGGIILGAALAARGGQWPGAAEGQLARQEAGLRGQQEAESLSTPQANAS